MIRNLIGSLYASFAGFGNLFKRSGPKRRRNAEFEKAGHESNIPPPADRLASSNLKRSVRERDLEVINAVRLEKKMLRRKDAEAQEFRKAKEMNNLEFSRGNVVSHLAAMQRKAAENKKLPGGKDDSLDHPDDDSAKSSPADRPED